MKFLVIWELEKLERETVAAVVRMPAYAKMLGDQQKLVARYHMVGKHGGAWIYDAQSNEEMERLLAMAPVYNYARYKVYPLADMQGPEEVMAGAEIKKTRK